MAQFKTVLDTNVIIASFSKHSSSPSKEILERWKNKEYKVLYSFGTLDEYMDKCLEIGISEEKIISLVQDLLNIGTEIFIEFFHFPKYPEDPEDTPFLLCALNGEATHLISYDKHLLDLDGTYEIKICEPVPFLKELRKSLKDIENIEE